MARWGSCEEYVWGLTFKRKQICKVVWGHSNIVRVSANEKNLGGKSRVSRFHKFQSLKAVLCTVDGIESRRNIYSCGVYSISAWYFWVYLQWWDNWGKEIWKQLLIYRTKYLNQSIRMKTFYLSLQGKRFFFKNGWYWIFSHAWCTRRVLAGTMRETAEGSHIQQPFGDVQVPQAPVWVGLSTWVVSAESATSLWWPKERFWSMKKQWKSMTRDSEQLWKEPDSLD